MLAASAWSPGRGWRGLRSASAHPARTTRASANWRSTALVSATVAVMGWKGWTNIHKGLDPSWQAGIADGFNHHLQWGPALDFTYGPYGFAGFLEPFYRMTTLIAFLYCLAITWGLAALLVGGMRRYFHWAAAGALSWAVIWLSYTVLRPADFSAALGLGLGLCLVQERRSRRRDLLAVLMGVLAGIAFLVKLNDGIIVFCLAVLAGLGAEVAWKTRWRAVALGTASFAVVFLVLWLAASQSLGNLASFARASLSLILGYSANMGGPLGPVSHALWAVAIVMGAGAVSVVALRRRARSTQVCVGLMLAGWCWAVTKDGFVNGDHYEAFFRVLLTAAALLALLQPPSLAYWPGLALAACITMAVTVVPAPDPFGGVHTFVSEVADLSRPGSFATLATDARAGLDRGEPLPARLRDMVDGHTLAVEPWEDMVAWALPAARWDPEPVVQSYSAYTAYTDHLDAAFMSSSRAPQLVLYWHLAYGFDDRDPYMDPPATTEAVYCHYEQSAVVAGWQVLRRVADRCGPARLIGVAHSRFGRQIEVPRAPGEMVVAAFSYSSTVLASLETAVLKGPSTYLETWAGGRRTKYRFVNGTAPDLHVVAAPTDIGYSRPFAPANVDRLELLGDGRGRGRGSLTVRFFAVPVAR